MEKLWTGRTSGEVDHLADDFNASIHFDSRLYVQDIHGSMAHAAMLGAQGIIQPQEADALIDGLEKILSDLQSGTISIDPMAEDIHMFVEQELTKRLGDVGKKLHTARSRNDQVALDLRIYLREQGIALRASLREAIDILLAKAELYKDTIMPGYTHLQRAQPITFGHHLMAYVMMFLRDLERLLDWDRHTDFSPIGSCALAGTTYPTDRFMEAKQLGFSQITRNSIDSVSDRDFCVELLSCIALLMMHLSRFSEELVLWCSWEYSFVELADAFTTGSSIMPQKKNPDMAELIRGKTGRVYGDLLGTLTMLKGLPLAYNKDMQEDKESVFDACDTVLQCLSVFSGMLRGLRAKKENMRRAAQTGFINATDLADYLVSKGLPFRSAYKVSGQIVAQCIRSGTVLEEMSMEDYHTFSPLFDEDVYEAIDLDACVARRNSVGGTSPASVEQQIIWVRARLATLCEKGGQA